MRDHKYKITERLLALLLAVVLVVSMVPSAVFAASPSELVSNIAATDFYRDTVTEFKATVTANDDNGKTVHGLIQVSDPVIVSKLEYQLEADKWQEIDLFKGDFGPAEGFALADGDLNFRVTFSKIGNVDFTIQLYDDSTVLCQTSGTAKVQPKPAALTSDLSFKTLRTGVAETFTVQAKANDSNSPTVVGAITVSDNEAVEKIEYQQNGSFREVNGTFGNTNGFRLNDASYLFRITFKKAGTFKVTVTLKNRQSNEVVATLEEEVTVNQTYLVTTSANAGGTVKVNGFANAETRVDENTLANLMITANSGYHIQQIKIGGVDQPVVDPENYITDILVLADTAVEVSFVQFYTITVTYDSTKGSVSTNPPGFGDVVTVEGSNHSVKIIATPKNETYRVSEVKINGVKDSNVTGENGKGYERSLPNLNQDTTVEITFSPNVYHVSFANTSNGTLSFVSGFSGTVEHGGSTKIKANPNFLYKLSSLSVNGVDYTGYSDDGELEIPNITEDITVKAVFSMRETVPYDNAGFDSVDKLRESDHLYVLGNKESIVSVYATDKYTPKSSGEQIFVEYDVYSSNNNKNHINAKANIDKAVNISLKPGERLEVTGVYFGRYKVSAASVRDISSTKQVVAVCDTTKPTVTFTPAEDREYYSGNVDITVTAEDPDDYSGISSVNWRIDSDAYTETDTPISGVLYPKDGSANVFEGTITVPASLNTDNNFLRVEAVDLAGNGKNVFSEYQVKINTIAPVVAASVTGLQKSGADAGYYSERTATVVFVDRAGSFNQTNAENAIHIEMTDREGNPITDSGSNTITWVHNNDQHTAVIRFNVDAIYNWYVGDYTNKAGMTCKAEAVAYTGVAAKRFVVDNHAPDQDLDIRIDEKGFWNSLLTSLSFGTWRKDAVTVTATAADTLSPIQSILYYMTDSETALTVPELDLQYQAGQFRAEKYTVNTDQKFVVYARITDAADNTVYIGTNGIVFDTNPSIITLTADPSNEYGYYQGNVNVHILVKDKFDGVPAFSGIKEVKYEIISATGHTKETVLYSFDKTDPVYSELKDQFEQDITVDATVHNADNVRVIVTAIDNVGNEYPPEEIILNINTTAPTAKIEFTDDYQLLDGTVGYYNDIRTAKITITDRATTFLDSAATAGITLTAVDFAGNPITDAYEISAWEHNGEEHTATVKFLKDAKFDWSYSYQNKAGKALSAIETGESKTPYSFVVDTTAPTGSVKIDTNAWTELLSVLTFGLYSKNEVTVSATGEDATSPVTLSYYKESANRTALTAAELDSKTFVPYTGDFKIDEDDAFVIYLKVTDYAGNYCYVSSQGFVVDMSQCSITLTADEPNANNIYNKDVNVAVAVTDGAPYSGIKSVSYEIFKDGASGETGNLFTFANTNPTYAQLVSQWNGDIHVNSENYNSCDVVVKVTVTDNAGNVSTKEVPLDIDVTKPVIAVTFDNNNDNGGNGYFDADRTATVVIAERNHHFNEAKATAGITITAADLAGNPVADAYTISSWSHNTSGAPDANTHTATIHFAADANYTFSIAYTDEADNENVPVDPFVFTVDTTPPTGTVTSKSEEGRTETWNALNDDLSFGFWSRLSITTTGTSEDVTSPIASVEYYKVSAVNASDHTVALTASELDAVSAWSPFDTLTVSNNEQFTVYLKITDMAGNYTYISTDGLIVDDRNPVHEMIAPEITINPPQPINELYNGDVKVSLQVVDPLVGGTYSGLKTVTYRVLNMGVETQRGTLFAFNKANPKQQDLVRYWSGNITVDANLNNSNDVVVEIYAEDNALNSAKDSVSMKIDITAPSVNVSYDNNAVDSNKYFKDNRTATIVVTERNFDAKDVKIAITNTDGTIPTVNGWTKSGGTGNGDDTRWTATITYAADGDYTFDTDYTDLANNHCPGVEYGSSVMPKEFTIDKTLPVITVSYDNNDARNGNYYKDTRTATITIREHNFAADRVKVALTASDDGAPVTLPTVNGWSNSGDTHTATIVYSADALYSFDIDVTDLAGNAAADYARETFYVDKTAPALEISGVKDHSANSGTVAPVITYSDTNLDGDLVKILLSGANRKSVDPDGSYTEIHNGQVFTFSNFQKVKEVDDIYTLTASVTDKAGNVTEQEIVFSVNRFGSTYLLNEATEALNGQYIQTPVDVTVTEVNANKLDNIKVTLFKNNETITLVEGTDYTVNVSGGNGQWYEYEYTILAKNFADDGVYRLTFHSEDEAGNVAENTLDTKDTAVSFGVDKTAPTVSTRNLENGKTYALENMTVGMNASDNLVLTSVTVYLDDYDHPYKTWDAQQIAEILSSNGEFNFDIPGDSTRSHKVKIVCVDAAGNETVEEITDFYVTTNVFVRYYNNKPLFFGSIGGVAVLIGGLFFLLGKKKKEEEKK